MKKSTTILLKIIVSLIALAIITFLLWMPQIEGVNQNATNFEIYFQDPFLAYAYVASLTFFVALYQIFKLLGYAGNNNLVSKETLKALTTIKYCALAAICFVVIGEITILSSDNLGEDRPPAIFMGLLVIFCAGVPGIIAAKFERILQTVIGIKLKASLII